MVKIKIDSRKIANSIVTLIALICVSFGITGIIIIVIGLVPTDQIINHYLTQGMPISLFGYKFTRKYYGKYNDTKQKLKQVFFG